MINRYFITCDEMYIAGKLGVRVTIQNPSGDVDILDVARGEIRPITTIPDKELRLEYRINGDILISKNDYHWHAKDMDLDIGKVQSILVDSSGDLYFMDYADSRVNSFLTASSNPKVNRWEGSISAFKRESIFDDEDSAEFPQFDPNNIGDHCWYRLTEKAQVINLFEEGLMIVFNVDHPSEIELMEAIACVNGKKFDTPADLAVWFYNGEEGDLRKVLSFCAKDSGRALPGTYIVTIEMDSVRKHVMLRRAERFHTEQIANTPFQLRINPTTFQLEVVSTREGMENFVWVPVLGTWNSILFDAKTKKYIYRNHVETRIDTALSKSILDLDLMQKWVNRIHYENGVTIDDIINRFSGYTGKNIECKELTDKATLVVESEVDPYIIIGSDDISDPMMEFLVNFTEDYLSKRKE